MSAARPHKQQDDERLTDEAAEGRVLGALLMLGGDLSNPPSHPDAGQVAEATLTDLLPGDFSRQWHRQLYGAIVQARRMGPWDFAAVCAVLSERGQLQSGPEQADMVGLVRSVVNVSMAPGDARAVRDLAIRRQLLQAASRIADLAYAQAAGAATQQAQHLLASLQARADQLGQQRGGRQGWHSGEVPA